MPAIATQRNRVLPSEGQDPALMSGAHQNRGHRAKQQRCVDENAECTGVAVMLVTEQQEE